MEKRIIQKKNEEKLLLEIVQQNMYFLEIAGDWYEQDEIRLDVLQDILWGLEYGKRDGLLQKIYLYGSMVKSEDLIARQLFLWLLKLVEDRSFKTEEKCK